MDPKTKQKINKIYGMLERQNKVVEKLQASKDQGYRERNMIVSVLSKFYPAFLGRHEETDTTWHKEWFNIIYIMLPTGQVSWHLHDSDLPLFAHLEYGNVIYDGHTTEEKYERLLALSR